MSTAKPRTLPLVAPSVILLFLWMIVPLVMTLWFSVQRYNLLNPMLTGFAGFENYEYLHRPTRRCPSAMGTTLLLVGWPYWPSPWSVAPCWRCCSSRTFMGQRRRPSAG